MDKKYFSDENSFIVRYGSGSPSVCMVGLCHGDELSGKYVVEQLHSALDADELLLQRGTLFLVKANLKAHAIGQRLVEDDLNRVFPGNATGSLEERIAFKLSSLIRECDYVFDFHSTHLPHAPFVFTTDESEESLRLAKSYGVDHIVHFPLRFQGGALAEYARARGKTSFLMEADERKHEPGWKIAHRAALSLLSTLEMISPEFKLESIHDHEYRVRDFIGRPLGTIEDPSLENFKCIATGTPYGIYGGTPLIFKKDTYPVLYHKGFQWRYFFQAADKVK